MLVSVLGLVVWGSYPMLLHNFGSLEQVFVLDKFLKIGNPLVVGIGGWGGLGQLSGFKRRVPSNSGAVGCRY